jgi:UDP-N-acetylglucosamine diphosphorylase/glucosamine-1-phosphate N-acetyltransferase
MKNFATAIMAAGKGTRMKSDLAKVLHKIDGRPMVHYVIELAQSIGSERTVLIIGHQRETVMEACDGMNVDFAVQAEQLGTGHAMMVTESLLADYPGDVLVLSGDVPLLTRETIEQLLEAHQDSGAIATLLTSRLDDPTGYGRVIRGSDGSVERIVEQKDANLEELKIDEINVGIYVFDAGELFRTLKLINNNNAQGEYYLPDVVKIYVDRGDKVVAQLTENFDETRGINNVDQLKEAETILRQRS